MRSLFDLVHEAASRDLGLIARARLIELGVPERTIGDWTRVGRLQTMSPGIYLVMGAPVTWETRVLAVCMSHGGAASHRTAAAIRGVPRVARTAPEIVKPHGAHAAPAPRVRRTRHFDDLGIRRVNHVPTVGPAPLALQLASLVPRQLPLERFEDAVEHLVRSGQVTWPVLAQRVEIGSARRTPGVRHLRALVDEYTGDGCESRLEREFLAFVREYDLPRPVEQFPVTLSCGRVLRLDFAYPAERVAIEMDSLEIHTLPHVVVDDREKRRRLRKEGWQVDEYTHRGLRRNGHAIAADLRASLAARRPPPRPGP